ncbi:type IV conjugative transfer system coupling protein TraD [Kosakonia pseudosacchari]|uniref:type IV conjugative transfer system coupling protein TraD n=1 Tax=Kosakonia pseudosacchari TaxID=1646340 RepID=UPI001882B41A|nr:type IV conjugative transfer system coupling protein TraD [Kosakonia pseudosacchari]QOV66460.1 type IV conjugative transfer system coupling protein TraD [Kosakonia pseudosacchari]
MSFKGKNLTQGGQMTAYRWRMFIQVNNWIGFWILVLFVIIAGALFLSFTSQEMIDNGSWYWFARLNESFIDLMPAGKGRFYDIHYFYAATNTTLTLKMTLQQMLTDPYMQFMGDQLAGHLKSSAVVAGGISLAAYLAVGWYVARIGKRESEDEFLSGMQLTEKPAEVNRLLRKNGDLSDLRVGDLHMVKNAEVMNFLIHGTIGVGKSTLIRWLLDYIRKRGDRAIIYDSGCTFTETHYNPKTDFILNPHDERCANWQLWDECIDVVDYENFAASLIPVEGESDPFWVSSSRTIASDLAIRMSADPDRSIEKFLKTLLSLSMQNLRAYLANTPSANLVEEKIEKTAISIRSVVTNYAKSLRFLQGLDDGTRPKFTIRNWMTSEQYSNSWLFISAQARHRNSVRSLISMWLSMATLFLQSMGENPDRRVWFIIDEKPGLQRIPQFAETVAEGRKFGGCFVIGIQNMPQLINVYGREMAKAIFDLLNTRMYGRSPSAEVAKMVEDELGKQRRKEAKEQNSYGMDAVRDGVSLGKDKVHEPVVDYEDVMKLPNLKFYVRLPGEYPVVVLPLKYRKFRKLNHGLIERNIRDALSPELEKVIQENERAAALAGLNFTAGESVQGKETAAASADGQTRPTASATPQEGMKTVKQPDLSGNTRPVSASSPAEHRPVAEQAQVSPVIPPRNSRSAPENSNVVQLRATSANQPEPNPAEPLSTVAKERTETQVAPERRTENALSLLSRVTGKPQPQESTPPAGALDLLNRARLRPSATGTEDAQNAESGGEVQEFQMKVTQLADGGLELTTAGHNSSPEQKARDDNAANRRMARDEENIIRHRQNDDPGYDEADFERYDDGEHEL